MQSGLRRSHWRLAAVKGSKTNGLDVLPPQLSRLESTASLPVLSHPLPI
jgi:hypothetical protein